MFDCIITLECDDTLHTRKHFLKQCVDNNDAYKIAEKLLGKEVTVGNNRHAKTRVIIRINIWDDVNAEWKDFNKYGYYTVK